MAIEIYGQIAGDWLDFFLRQIDKIEHVVLKAFNMNDIGIVIQADGSAVSAMIQSPDFIAGLEHVINGFRKFADGFRKAVDDHDHALGTICFEMLKVDLFALDAFKISGFRSIRHIGLGQLLHLLRVVFFRDPTHVHSPFYEVLFFRKRAFTSQNIVIPGQVFLPQAADERTRVIRP